MKIAIVHSFYSNDVPSGENSIVESFAEGLVSLGHQVLIASEHTDDLHFSKTYPLRSAIRVATGSGKGYKQELIDFQPNVVHVHNLFPNLGSKWIRDIEFPVISTIHNFRSHCANGLFFRDGTTCFDCATKGVHSSLKYGCYRQSRVATAPVTIGLKRKLLVKNVYDTSRFVIAPSRLVSSKYIELGVPADKLRVIPHGVEPSPVEIEAKPRRKWLFVGRLSAEKGLAKLLAIWPEAETLDIIGGMPSDMPSLGTSARIRFLGKLPKEEVRDLLPNYLGLVFPSQCLETQGLVVLEAIAAGVPTVALSGNAGAETVTEHKIGAVYHDSVSLRESLQEIDDCWAVFHENCRKAYLGTFSRDKWLASHIDLFESLR